MEVMLLDKIILVRKTPIKFKLSPEQIERIKLQKILQAIKRNLAYIYDADKAKYYRNLLNFYNNNFFGYGRQTRYDPTTPEGLAAILSNFNYAKSNAETFLGNMAGVGTVGAARLLGKSAAKTYTRVVKGVFREPTNNGALGSLRLYSKNPIGAEAIVVNNTPTTVGKMTSISRGEMAIRNGIPNTIPSRYIGYVKDRGVRLPTYVLKKVKVLTEETFPKYVERLDLAMQKSGFRRVNDPNVQYRAYTNGRVVVDDISPGNVGLDWLRRPKIIDSSVQTVPDWIGMGFTLKNGGKILY